MNYFFVVIRNSVERGIRTVAVQADDFSHAEEQVKQMLEENEFIKLMELEVE